MRSPCSWRRPFIPLDWRPRLIFVCSSIRHKGNVLLQGHNFVYHPQKVTHLVKRELHGRMIHLQLKVDHLIYLAKLDWTLSGLWRLWVCWQRYQQLRRCARTARALLCQLRSAQLHLVHKSFPKFLSNRIHLTLHTKVISLNIKRNQTKNTHENKTNPMWRQPYWAPFILSQQSLLVWG